MEPFLYLRSFVHRFWFSPIPGVWLRPESGGEWRWFPTIASAVLHLKDKGTAIWPTQVSRGVHKPWTANLPRKLEAAPELLLAWRDLQRCFPDVELTYHLNAVWHGDSTTGINPMLAHLAWAHDIPKLRVTNAANTSQTFASGLRVVGRRGGGRHLILGICRIGVVERKHQPLLVLPCWAGGVVPCIQGLPSTGCAQGLADGNQYFALYGCAGTWQLRTPCGGSCPSLGKQWHIEHRHTRTTRAGAQRHFRLVHARVPHREADGAILDLGHQSRTHGGRYSGTGVSNTVASRAHHARHRCTHPGSPGTRPQGC